MLKIIIKHQHHHYHYQPPATLTSAPSASSSPCSLYQITNTYTQSYNNNDLHAYNLRTPSNINTPTNVNNDKYNTPFKYKYINVRRYCSTPDSNASKQVEIELHQKKHNTVNPLQCWSCNKFIKKQDFFCGACNIVLPVVEEKVQHTLFELFQIPEQFDLDLHHLSARFKQLQRKLHPDLFSRKSEQEKEFSASQSAGLNHAYNVLKTPHLRAEYLLRMHGIDVSETMGTIFDQELLMEIMEMREQVEELDKDAPELKSIAQSNRKHMEGLITELADAFAKHDYGTAKAKTVKLRYLTKIQEEIIGKVGAHL